MPKGQPKVISPEVKEVLLKITDFFVQEKLMDDTIIPLQKVHERVAAATGVSLHTVSNIVKEGKLGTIGAPKKERKVRKDKYLMSESDLDSLRRKIHDHFAMTNEMPTIPKLLSELREEINFKGSREILRRYVLQVQNERNDVTINNDIIIRRNESFQASCLEATQHPEHLLHENIKQHKTQSREDQDKTLDGCNPRPATYTPYDYNNRTGVLMCPQCGRKFTARIGYLSHWKAHQRGSIVVKT